MHSHESVTLAKLLWSVEFRLTIAYCRFRCGAGLQDLIIVVFRASSEHVDNYGQP